MHIAVIRLKAVLIFLGFMGIAANAGAQRIIPDAPVSDFKLPIFGLDGYKSWELAGKQGKSLSPNKIEVQRMVLKVYSADEAMRLEATLESALAYVYPREHRASGPGYLHILGSGFTVLGHNWTWKSLSSTQDAKSGHSAWVEIREQVRVTFKQSLSKVL